jgi:hypothetical protein
MRRNRFVLRRALFVWIVCCGIAAHAQLGCPADTRFGAIATQFTIRHGGIEMPIGAFLLVRKNGRIGAIRLTRIDDGATEWLGKSAWESFYQPDGSGLLMAKDVVHRTGELNVQPLKGPGRDIYMYEPGTIHAFVGKWKFLFGSPSMMTMSDASFWTGVGDHGFEFAPTSACNLSEVNTQDKRLKWFRFDRAASLALPLSDLPK